MLITVVSLKVVNYRVVNTDGSYKHTPFLNSPGIPFLYIFNISKISWLKKGAE
jgi:formate-dependent nitrite reductase membrane component NrfD